MKIKTKYPLSGFDKITWEEFMGIYELISSCARLSGYDKQIIDILINGLKREHANDNNL